MSLLFCDSFDGYTTAAQAVLKWGAGTGGTPGASGTGRNGSQCLPLGGLDIKKTITARATGVVGVAFKPTNSPTEGYVFRLMDGTTEQISVRWVSATKKLKVCRGATLLATGTTDVPLNTYAYVELKATIATVGTYELHLNGATEIASSSGNTQASGNASFNGVWLDTASDAWTAHFDDFYIDTDTFLGDVRIECLFPTSDGATSAWTPSAGTTHYTLVDDTSPNGDTDYVSSGAVGQVDTWGYGNLASVTGTVKGIQVVASVKKDLANPRTVAPVLRIGGTDYVQADLPALTTTYQLLTVPVAVSPATSSAFTISEINAMEAGCKVTS